MRVILCLLLWASFSLVHAHTTQNSAVFIDIQDQAVGLELHLPLDQLRLALPAELAQQPLSELLPPQTALADYIAAHISAADAQQRYAVKVDSVQLDASAKADHLLAKVRLIPDSGQVDSFTLDYDVVLHRVVNHKILLNLRSDFKSAVFAQQPQALGVLRYQHHSINIDLSQRSWWRGFYSVFQTGLQHIAQGFDHLLFLFALLLPAPLLAQRGTANKLRWSEQRPVWHSIAWIVRLISAFTLGHSVTLALGVWGMLQLPSQWVESVVAVSILLSALHAIRPLFIGYEAWIALGFGLVHGLAFASELHQLGYDWQSLMVSVLAFNLGIETMQFIIVLSVMPSLLLLSRQLWAYHWVRLLGASFAGVAAVNWLLERTLQVENHFDPVVVWVFGHGMAFSIGLAMFAVLLWSAHRWVWRVEAV